MDPTLLQQLLNGYRDALAPGLATMKPFVVMLLSFLVALEGLRVWNRVLEDGGHWQQGGAFVVRSLVLASVIMNWPAIMTGFVEDCVRAGLTFGGRQMTVAQFLDPGTLLQQGVKTAQPLTDAVLANSGLRTFVYGIGFLVAWWIFIAAFFAMSISVFLVQAEFRVVIPVAILVLPLLLFGPTRQMGMGVLSYGLNTGLKFFLKAVLASVTFRLIPILASTAFVQRNTFDQAMLVAVLMIAAAWMQALLFLLAPALVAQTLQGGGALSVGGVFQGLSSMLFLGRTLGGGGGGRPRLPRRADGGGSGSGPGPTLRGQVVPPTPPPAPAPNTRLPERMALGTPSLALPAPEATWTALRNGAQYYSPPPPRTGREVVPYRSVVRR